jgi:ATPase subunit of ABC transporter with duplicated ATPase domains
MPEFIYISDLTFTYENTVEPLFDSVTFHLQTGWTGIVGANGSGKTTLLKLLTGHLPTKELNNKLPTLTYYCEQRTDDSPDGLIDFLNSTEKSAFRIRSDLDIHYEWVSKWDLLSHGERKRCQLGTALYQNPSLLAVDEPSNHLDQASREVLFRALKKYPGIGILVSHDRMLLDDLCTHTLFIDPPKIDLRHCSYSIASAEREKEYLEISRLSKQVKQEVKRLKKRVQQQEQKAKQSDRRVSKRNVGVRDHDAKSKIDHARLSGKDAVAGRIKRRLQTQLNKTVAHKDELKVKKDPTLGVSFDNTENKKYFPIILPAAKISMGASKSLNFPEFVLNFGDKIGIRGNNGCGKSTLIEYFLTKINIEENQIIYIPQEISLDQSKKMITRIHDYDNERKGKIMTLISRLGSDPKHVIETKIPSPGEVRKLMLAEGIMRNPVIIIMDEPTNHMDLPSVQCTEEALKECPAAQLLVSHDPIFLKNTVFEYWTFSAVSDNEFRIVVER